MIARSIPRCPLPIPQRYAYAAARRETLEGREHEGELACCEIALEPTCVVEQSRVVARSQRGIELTGRVTFHLVVDIGSACLRQAGELQKALSFAKQFERMSPTV